VVYSAACAPYGKIQHTWVNTYQPKLQFSGKEREAETGLDYFGARYYANGQYRFVSVDPIISKEGAVSNPQLWNLYAYCRNNPITFIDPNGKTDITIVISRSSISQTATFGNLTIKGTDISVPTLEQPWRDNKKYESSIPTGSYPATIEQNNKYGGDIIRLSDTGKREGILIHQGYSTEYTEGCILVGDTADIVKQNKAWTRANLDKVTNVIRMVKIIDALILKERTNINVMVSYDLNLSSGIGFNPN
jgi:RHS repeat-associated protein